MAHYFSVNLDSDHSLRATRPARLWLARTSAEERDRVDYFHIDGNRTYYFAPIEIGAQTLGLPAQSLRKILSIF